MPAQRSNPTFLGTVSAVSGSVVQIELAPQLNSGILIIGGRSHKIGQVGSFVRIPQGYNNLYGIISETSETSSIQETDESLVTRRRWIKVDLVGETIGDKFERGIGQHPSINDEAHIVVDKDLEQIYGEKIKGQTIIGKLSSSESISVSIDLEKLVTRHSAVLGSTGSGKSTSVSSMLRSIVCDEDENIVYPSSRIVLIDIHGEYTSALGDIAETYSVNPKDNEKKLVIPYWCVSPDGLLEFLCGQLPELAKNQFIDKIIEQKNEYIKVNKDLESIKKLEEKRITPLTPLPYSLKKVWYDMCFDDGVTWSEKEFENPEYSDEGDYFKLLPPKFKPPAAGGKPPYKGGNNSLKKQLRNFQSKMQDHQYSFILNPGEYEPDAKLKHKADLDDLLESWIGHSKPITILDLSSIPSDHLSLLLGSLLDILFESALWGRNLAVGMKEKPLLLVLEEAHRYLSRESSGFAKSMVKRIAKEGRKFGLGLMLVSQRPSEIDETILSQCGTLIALRINNDSDRSRVKSALSDGISGIIDSLPVLRTGEAVIAGESARLPMRCKFRLPKPDRYPDSVDPAVSENWIKEKAAGGYDKLALAWRNQNPFMADDKEEDGDG